MRHGIRNRVPLTHPRRFAAFSLLAAVPCIGQVTGGATVDSVLTQLSANAVAYEAHLPSLSCREHITSQLLVRGEVRRASDVDDVVRVLRNEHADPTTEEQRIPVNAAGEPQEGKRMPALPLLLLNGIYGGQADFKDLASSRMCFDWSLDTSGSKLRLNMQRKTDAAAMEHCPHAGDGLQGFVLVDRESGQMVYRTHTIDVSEAMKLSRDLHENRATRIETSYAPATFGTETFSIPTRIYAEFGPDRHYTATYSGCRRFTANGRIVDVGPAQ